MAYDTGLTKKGISDSLFYLKHELVVLRGRTVDVMVSNKKLEEDVTELRKQVAALKEAYAELTVGRSTYGLDKMGKPFDEKLFSIEGASITGG